MTRYGLTITDAPCPCTFECAFEEDGGVCPCPAEHCDGSEPRCNRDGTRTIDTGRDATPLAEAVKALRAGAPNWQNERAVFAAALALFPKEDTE